MKKIFLILIIAAAAFLAAPLFLYGQEPSGSLPKLIVFHSRTCHRCIEAKNEVMPDIEKEFGGRLEIEYRDIADIDNYTFMLSLEDKYHAKVEAELPVFFLSGKFLNAKGEIRKNLQEFISKSLNKGRIQEQGGEGIDLLKRFKGFRLLAIVVAGLEDGINPCAFTVIVFFISFLALQGYRKLELIAIGLAFISAVFLTYLLIGLGIFNFLYSLKGFWVFTRALNISIGAFSIVLGFLALYDFFKYKKTGETEGLLLQLPQAIKNRIHSVIGMHYRRPKGEDAKTQRRSIFRLLLSSFITGFLVSLLEAVCTGQLYLPTITFVLKTTNLKLQAFAYLLLYNIMFILPLFIIFSLSLFGTTSEQFSRFLKKHLLSIKLLMVVVFFAFGIFLIWRG